MLIPSSQKLERRLENIFAQLTEFIRLIHQKEEILEVLELTTQTVRNLLNVDRCVVYQLLPDGDGVVLAESVETKISPILGQMIYDPCFQAQWIEPYRLGRISKIEDIETSSLESCHIDLLKSFNVRANLVLPINLGNAPHQSFWGLLIVHQCHHPRRWRKMEIKILQHIIVHMSIVLEKLPQRETLSDREERYRSIIDTMTEGVIFQNQSGEVIASNESLERLLGLSKQEIKRLNRLEPQWQAIDAQGNPFLPENYPPLVTLATGKPQLNIHIGIQRPQQQVTWLAMNSHPLFRPASPHPYAVVTFFEDITDYKLTEQHLQHQLHKQNLVQQIIQSIHQSLDLEQILQTTVAEVRQFLDTDRVVIYRLNSDGSRLVKAESVLSPWRSILHFELKGTDLADLKDILPLNVEILTIADILAQDLNPCQRELMEWLQVRSKMAVPIRQNEQIWGLLIAHHCREVRQWQPLEADLFRQLAEQLGIAIHQAQLHQNIQNLALIDALTQIANRYCFERHLYREWQRLTRDQSPLSLILCDIDHFKQYNDTYGHPEGDLCLIQVAQTLQQVAKRPTDLVARLGGEEFALILPNTPQQGAIQVAQRLRHNLHQLRILHEASPVADYVTLSMGITTLIPTLDSHPSQLIDQADQALYQAKRQGKDSFQVFSA